MKPLLKKDIKKFTERFDDFCNAEIRSAKVNSQHSMTLSMVVQDKARTYDWIALELEFNEIEDAKLLEDEKLRTLDTSEGFSLFSENEKIVFCVEKYYNMQNAINSSVYIVCKSLKYNEEVFYEL